MRHQIKKTNKTRQRIIFSILPLTIISSIFVWTGEWLSFVVIQEEKIKIKYLEFDEYYCLSFWGEWQYQWEFVKIIK